MRIIDPTQFEYCSGQQKSIVNSNAKHILVNGCAGCRKTQTLVFRAILEAQHKGRNVIILTFVGSVTSEIMERIEREINVKFFRHGNHYYLNFPQGNTLEVANYDAMIHKQLQASGDPIVFQNGDWFSEKTRRLLGKIETGRWKEIIMINNSKADYLLVDEFQDMSLIQAQVLGNILKRNQKIESMVLGDYLQSIFGELNEDPEEHAMDYWQAELKPMYYQMEICFRCPPNHIGLSNLLLEEERRKRLIPDMTYPRGLDYGDRRYIRPILFTHPPLSGADNPQNIVDKAKKNTNAKVLADQVVEALNTLREIDPFQPEDVCIIMSKVNNNAVFIQLKNSLERFYRKLGWPEGAVAYLETRIGGDRYSIDWTKAKGKSVLASIHGIKGKGYPIIFFLGLTEGCLPQENRLFKDAALIDHSLLNVALTRSTKWLFVGFAGGKPSRYLLSKWRILMEACALSWSTKYQRTIEEKLLCGALFNRKFCVLERNWWRFPLVKWEHYLTERIERPNKFMNNITGDVLNAFSHPLDLEPRWKIKDPISFGRPQEMAPFPEMDMNLVWGTLANLLVIREHSLLLGQHDVIRQNIGFFVEPWKNIYISLDDAGDTFLNVVHDLDINMQVKAQALQLNEFKDLFQEAYDEYEKYINFNPKLKDYFDMVFNLAEPKIFLPTFLKSIKFQEDVMDFLSPRPLEELRSQSIWNIALAYSFVSGEIRRPQLAQYFNYGANMDWRQLYRNVRAFLELKRGEIDTWRFEATHFIGGIEANKEILKRMGVRSDLIHYGIKGRSDIISLRNGSLYEIKNSVGNKKGFNNYWGVQTLCYYTLPLINFTGNGPPAATLPRWQNVEIVDIRQGMLWNVVLEHNDPEKVLRRWLILSKINKRLGFIEEHQKRMLTKLKNLRG